MDSVAPHHFHMALDPIGRVCPGSFQFVYKYGCVNRCAKTLQITELDLASAAWGVSDNGFA